MWYRSPLAEFCHARLPPDMRGRCHGHATRSAGHPRGQDYLLQRSSSAQFTRAGGRDVMGLLACPLFQRGKARNHRTSHGDSQPASQRRGWLGLLTSLDVLADPRAGACPRACVDGGDSVVANKQLDCAILCRCGRDFVPRTGSLTNARTKVSTVIFFRHAYPYRRHS